MLLNKDVTEEGWKWGSYHTGRGTPLWFAQKRESLGVVLIFAVFPEHYTSLSKFNTSHSQRFWDIDLY